MGRTAQTLTTRTACSVLDKDGLCLGGRIGVFDGAFVGKFFGGGGVQNG